MGFLQLKRFLTLVLVFCGAATLFGLYNGKVELDKADGFYKVGETATCSVKLTKDGKPLTGAKVRCTIKWECTPVAIKDFETTGKPVKFSYKADKPGWVYFGFEVLGENGEFVGITDEMVQFECDTVIVAVSQKPKDKLSFTTKGLACHEDGTLMVSESGQTTVSGVFGAGDVVTGPKTVVHAVEGAKVAIEGMKKYMGLV